MQDLKKRTKQFSFDCWEFCASIPKSREFNAWVHQLIRSSSSVGANYRASQRAKSNRDFINKLTIVEEEADESMFWLELLGLGMPSKLEMIGTLHKEANELLAITVASIKTARRNENK